MNNYFLTKITQVSLNTETGKQDKISIQNLINAETFTEAESCLNKEFETEFHIDSISNYKVSEIIDGGGDWFFKVKCILIIYDEEKGKEKRVTVPYLVKSDSVKLAEASFNEFMKDTMSDYEIAGVEQTKIDEVFEYVKNLTDMVADILNAPWDDEDSETDLSGGQSENN